MSTPARRSAVERPHVARTLAAAARAADSDEVPLEQEPVGEGQPRVGRPREVDAPRMASGRKSYRGRGFLVYFPSDADKERAMAAFRARGGVEGYTSASDWMADVILERTEQWEQDANGGRPFTEMIQAGRARRHRTG